MLDSYLLQKQTVRLGRRTHTEIWVIRPTTLSKGQNGQNQYLSTVKLFSQRRTFLFKSMSHETLVIPPGALRGCHPSSSEAAKDKEEEFLAEQLS